MKKEVKQFLKKAEKGIINFSYKENHREYHNQHHIKNMLTNFKRIQNKHNVFNEKEEFAIIYAIIFHDANYIPGDKENEDKSAKFAVNVLRVNRKVINPMLNIDNEEYKEIESLVYKLIMSTQYPFTPSYYKEKFKLNEREYHCIKMMHDLDFLSLSTNYHQFIKRQKQTRKEYCNYHNKKDNEEFVKIQKNFMMKEILKKDENNKINNIYTTKYFINLNSKAISNILRFNQEEPKKLI